MGKYYSRFITDVPYDFTILSEESIYYDESQEYINIDNSNIDIVERGSNLLDDIERLGENFSTLTQLGDSEFWVKIAWGEKTGIGSQKQITGYTVYIWNGEQPKSYGTNFWGFEYTGGKYISDLVYIGAIIAVDEEHHQIVIGEVDINSDGSISANPSVSQKFYNEKLYTLLTGYVSDSDDPYNKDGESGDGGGDGDFTDEDENIPVPSLPDKSIIDTGLVTLYNPNNAQMLALANYLWTSDFIETVKKLWSDPMNILLGLNIVPFALSSSGTVSVKTGNIDTGIEMPKVSTQWYEVDCGSLHVKRYYGSYMDYAPYTKFSIYLPYIGMRQISTDDIMNKTINVTYHCDALTGACVAYISCGGKVLYSFSGNVATQIPLTAQNMAQVYTAAIDVATSAGVAVATGGATAPQLANTLLHNAGAKPEVQKSGSAGGTSGLLGIQYPYLIKERPNQCTPKSQNKYTGYPSFSTKKMKDLKKKGFTKIENIRLISFDCTSNEKDELLTLLKEGVIFR